MPTRRDGKFEFRVRNQQDSQYFAGCFLVSFSVEQERAWRKREYRKARKSHGMFNEPVPDWVLNGIRYGSRPLIARTRDQRLVWQWVFWKDTPVYATKKRAQVAARRIERRYESEYGIHEEEWDTPLPTKEEAEAAAKRAGPLWEELLKYPERSFFGVSSDAKAMTLAHCVVDY